ncbi:tyrosine-protein kinase receptor, partial [Elysia marginata]
KAERVICVSIEAYKNNSGGYRLENLKPGNYSVSIQVFTEGGIGPVSRKFYFHIDAPLEKTSGLSEGSIVAIICSVIILCMIIILCAAVLYYRFQRQSKLETVSRNPHYFFSEDFYVPDEWEVGRDNISFIKEVGQGSFGKVYEGIMRDTNTHTSSPVAIKTVNDKADFFEKLKFLKEASTMKYFECHHVVKLLGVVSQGQPALMIMELMALGDLRNYLRKCREDEEDYPDFHPPTASRIRQMAGEIADGMAYLSHRKIIHRDLAARNCLVGGDGTVKIGDFGMARELDVSNYYRKDQKALLPVRWMAPESLNEGIFTTMSDVWSYGVVMYEMVTLAEQPYIGQSNDEVFAFVIGGGTMRAPVGCPQDL